MGYVVSNESIAAMKTAKEIKQNLFSRLALITVAVVFALGTMALPAGVYASEPEAEGDAVIEAVETTPNALDDDTADAEAAGPEAQEKADEAASDETESETTAADLEELVENTGEGDYEGYLYKVKDDTTKAEIREMEESIDELDANREVEEVIEGEVYAADSLETISEVAKTDQIEFIEPNFILQACASPNDKYYEDYGWYLEMINAPYVWDRGMFGSGTTVAVLDSGVKMDHEDFASDLFIGKYNAIADSQDITDNSGHGTAVTGIVAASYNNGKGMPGIMPETKIMPVKVMDYNTSTGETEGSLEDIIRGINYAANNGADVINLSAGSTQYSSLLETACRNAANKGVIFVAAAGNDSDSSVEYPASYDTVVSVGSIERDGAHSSFSNYNKYVAVAAPGRSIAAPWNNGSYKLAAGTSFSAPQVAAMAAMVKQMDPSVNYAGFMSVIAATSADRGATGYDPYFGYGLMDMEEAYFYMAGDDISAYDVSFSSASYVYDGKAKTPSVALKRAGKALSSEYYQVSYASGRTNVGSYKVTVTGRNGYTGSRTASFKIVPPLVKGIKAPTRQKKKLTVRWAAMSKSQRTKYKNAITGYQVRVATNSQFTGAKTVKVKGITKTRAAVSGLKAKTTYYVQYRAYKTVGSATYYSKWSGTKKAKTK